MWYETLRLLQNGQLNTNSSMKYFASSCDRSVNFCLSNSCEKLDKDALKVEKFTV